ncbi:lactonase family protein [Streptomyces sp. NPDC059740]|uniref:lactonase family protein n=1 Tax=Streptomyces sp. NPDC059740 TaxID=3346926 RepID=UPI00365BF14E
MVNPEPARNPLSRRRFAGSLVAGAVLTATAGSSPAQAHGRAHHHHAEQTRPLFLGTYTDQDGGGKGIGLGSYDPVSGRITATGVIEGVHNPSYLAFGPSGSVLYAVNETVTAGEDGGVTAVALRPDGGHEVLGRRSTGGAGPCHLSVHPGGAWLLSANYLSGSVAVHPIGADGALGERTDLKVHSSPAPGPGQDGPHAHQVLTSPDGGHVLAVDLGTDTVYTYRLDTGSGTLTQVSTAALRPGAGPRHLTFHPGGRIAYLANEVDNTVVVCAYDVESGRLTPGEPLSTGTRPGVTSYPAQFAVTADGAWAFLANRGDNTITRYAIEDEGRELRLLDTVPVGGDFPRHLALSPDDRLLFTANQKSGDVSVFTVGPGDGSLTSAGPAFDSPVAVCVRPR